MTELADKARFQPDGRIKKLTEWIRANQLKERASTGPTFASSSSPNTTTPSAICSTS